MTVRLLRTRNLGLSTVLLCTLSGAGASLFGQARDFNAERLLLDDNAGDGTRNTLTLQVPGTGLSANRTLTFPDGDGVVLTLSGGSLAANQILFGGAGGQVTQNAGLLWDNSTSIFNIGSGEFTVDGTTGNTDVGGTLNVGGTTTLVGAVDAQGAGNTIGDGTDAEQLQVSGVDGGAVEVDINGDADISGTLAVGALVLNGDLDMNDNDILNIDELRGNSTTGDLNINTTNVGAVNIGNGSGDINVGSNVVPTADNTFSLGTDAVRFSDLFVNGGSVHVGEANGLNTGSEMELGFVGIVGTINVLGGDPEIELNGDAVEIRFDPNGDGTVEAAVTGGGIRVNSGGGANAVFAEDGISRNGAGTQTFDFTNGNGGIDVRVGGSLDVDADLNVDGTSTFVGVVDAQAAGNTIGDGTDTEQLQVSGVDGGAVEVDINGDADVSGTLTVGTLALTGNLDMNQNDIVDLGNVVFSTAGSNLSNSAGDVTVDDAFVVTGGSDLQGALGTLLAIFRSTTTYW